MKITLLTKENEWGDKALTLAKIIFGAENIFLERGNRGDPLPNVGWSSRDALISFLCPWIIPKSLLSRFNVAINFHPASADYPGIGCYNFALYEGDSTYGAICHHMVEKVDSGPIIEERRFPMMPDETVETLKFRTMVTLLAMFHDVLAGFATTGSLPQSGATWRGKARTRKELDALCVLTPDMLPEEVARRVRATAYPGAPGAYIAHVTLGGVTFAADIYGNRKPLA